MFLLVSWMPNVFAFEDQSWNFRVYLDNKEIGYQTFILTRKPNGSSVLIEARFDVNLLFINIYSYRHNNHEVWRKGCLQSIESKTDDNGKKFFVLGSRQDQVFSIKNKMGEKHLKGCIKTFSYWDPSFLNSTHLLNSQTGELTSVKIQNLGTMEIKISKQLVPAVHYHISAREFELDLWYSTDHSEWLALESSTVAGSVLRYQRI
jgi:hypothetical protein